MLSSANIGPEVIVELMHSTYGSGLSRPWRGQRRARPARGWWPALAAISEKTCEEKKWLFEKARGSKKLLAIEGYEDIEGQRVRVQILIPEKAISEMINAEARRQEALTVFKSCIAPHGCTKVVLRYNTKSSEWSCEIH